MIWPARDDIRYTPLFCEENIWWLARSLIDGGVAAEQLSVLLFCNPWQGILMSAQRAGDQDGQAIWDYHMVLRAEHDGTTWVFDPDSCLTFPTPCEIYLKDSFPTQSRLPMQVRTWVRRVPASDYLRYFHSDRQHMLDQIPAVAFPDYPIIAPPPGKPRITLAEYRNLQRELDDGSQVLPVEQLCASSG